MVRRINAEDREAATDLVDFSYDLKLTNDQLYTLTKRLVTYYKDFRMFPSISNRALRGHLQAIGIGKDVLQESYVW